MFEQLSGAQERYQAINDRLMDPNVVSDPKQYAELMKEYKKSDSNRGKILRV